MVVVSGATTKDGPVWPPFQVYVAAPDAVNVALWPLQSAADELKTDSDIGCTVNVKIPAIEQLAVPLPTA